MPGFGELIIILVVLLLVFGANKLPRLGEGIGKAIKNFKRGLQHDEDDDAELATEERHLAAHAGAASEPGALSHVDVTARVS
jgi:sec-independent protein translocase protein TatA